MQKPNLTAILTAVEAGRVASLLITRPFESCHPLQGGPWGARLVRLTTAAIPASDQAVYDESEPMGAILQVLHDAYPEAVDVERCDEILRRGKERGIVPRPLEQIIPQMVKRT